MNYAINNIRQKDSILIKKLRNSNTTRGMINMTDKNTVEMNEQVIFKLISFSGEARSNIYEAYELVMNGEYEKAEESLKQADKTILEAHSVQTTLIQKEAQGIHTEISLLMVHAQDHLMSTLLSKDLIKNMIHMQKEINELKEKLIK